MNLRMTASVAISKMRSSRLERELTKQVTYVDAVLNLFNDASYQSFMAAPCTYGVTIRMRF